MRVRVCRISTTGRRGFQEGLIRKRPLILVCAVVLALGASAATVVAFQIPTSGAAWTGTGATQAATKDTPSGLRTTLSVSGAGVTVALRNNTNLTTQGATHVPALPATTNGIQFSDTTTACQTAFAAATTCTPGTLGQFTVAFGDGAGNPIAVKNPVLHFSRIGGSVGGTKFAGTMRVATPGVVLGAPTAGSKIVLLGGNTVAADIAAIDTSGACPNAGCGSVPTTGTYSSVAFDVGALRSDTANAWTSAVDSIFLTVSFDEDFGDAPASYDAGTAASHIVSDLVLGTGITPDTPTTINGGATGTPLVTSSPLASVTATGDTDDANPVFPPLNENMAGQTYVVPVSYSGGTRTGQLCGWIDFNANGTFGAGEQACGATATGAGTVNLNFTVPATITAGATFSRFRVGYTAAQVQSPNGLADSGEVEDYPVTIQRAADLVIGKTGPATVVQGNTVTYTIVVTNNGKANVTGAQIADTVPANLTGVAWTCVVAGTADCDTGVAGTGAAGSGNAIALNAVQVNAGPGNTVTLTVTGTATTPGAITNTGTVAPPAGVVDTNSANNTSSVSTTITPAADLAVTKTGPAAIVQGNTITYSVVVTNNGPSAVSGATLTDTVPANITGVSWNCVAGGAADCNTGAAGTGATGTGNAISLSAVQLNAGAGNSVTITVTGTASTTGAIANTASVAPPTGTTDPTAANNTSTVTTTITPAADLAVAKSGPATVVQGNTVSYTITVTNNGPSNVTGASVADAVPANLTGVTFTCVAAGTADCDTVAGGTGATGTGNAISLSSAQLNAGAANTLTITVTGTATTAGGIANTATVAAPAGTTDPTPANNTSTVNTTISPSANLAVVKTGPATVVQGSVVSYTITVTNAGPSNVTGASVADTVPANLTGVSFTCVSAGTADCDTGAAGTGATGTGNVISLANVQLNAGVGNSVTITVTGTATTTATPVGISNTATVAPPAGTTDPTPGNNTSTVTTTITPTADLAVLKTGPATAVQGTTVTYTIVVTNNGPSNVSGASVSDSVPANLTGVSFTCVAVGTADCDAGAAGTGATGTGNVISLSAVQLNAGAGNAITVTVTGAATTPGAISNTATVAPPAGTTDPVAGNDSSSVNTTITPAADLAVVKSGPATVVQGNTVTYTVTVTNNGPSAVTGATVADSVPANLTGVSFTCVAVGTADCDGGAAGTGATGTGNVISLSAVQLNAGAGNAITVTVTGAATTPGAISNTATVAPPAGTTDPVAGNDSSSVNTTITPAADLAVTKTGPASVLQGATVTYTITVTNNGPSNVTGASVTDAVPANLTGVTFTCLASGTADCDTGTAGTGASGSGNAISLSALQLNAGAGHNLAITVTGTAATPGAIVNTASVAPPAGTTDPVAGNNAATVNTSIVPAADLAITKTGTGAVVQGNTVTYTITVTNNGFGSVTGASVTDSVPVNLTGVTFTCVAAGTADCDTAAAGTGATGATNAISLPNVQLNAGAGNSLTITVTGAATTPGAITNTATVTPPAGTTDPTPGNDAASQPTTITPAADLAVTKTGPPTIVGNQAVTYTITVTNNGPSNVTGASVTDTVPADVVVSSWTCVATGTADCDTGAAGTGATGATNAISLPNVQLNAGAGNSLTVAVTGTAIGVPAATITNSASVTPPPGTTDPTAANNTATTVASATPAADLAITKTGPATVVQGTTVTYTIVVTNAGPANVTGATIADTVPGNITPVSWTCVSAGTASCGTPSGNTNAISLLANINAGAGNSITITVTGTAALTAASPGVTNTATVTAPGTVVDGNTANNTSSVNTIITPAADVAITKTGTATALQGGVVTYTITVTNNGPSDVVNAQISDLVPAGITVTSWTCAITPPVGGADCANNLAGTGATGTTNTIQLDNVDLLGSGGAGRSLTITVTGTATTAGSFTNTATVTPPAGTTDPTPANNTASQPTTITPAADLAITKTGTATIVQGNTATYTIVATNLGPGNVTGAAIADTVPANLTGVTWTCVAAGVADCNTGGAGTGATGSGNAISLAAVQLNAGAGNSVTITVTGTATTPGAITNTATITPPAGTTDTNAANDTSSQATTVTPAADLAISKTGPATVVQGTTVTYAIVVTNLGPSNVTGATIADTVPANITPLSWTCVSAGIASCGTPSGITNAISLLADINAGAGNSVTITVTGTAAATGTITNTATVAPPAGTADPVPGNNTSAVTTTITPAADLAVTKTGTATVVEGDAVTYAITVTNNGPSPVTGSQVSDTVPANLTSVAFSCVVTGTGDCDTTSPTVPFTGTGNAISLANVQLDVGASLTITVTATATTPGDIVNTATVAPPAGTTDPTPANNTASQPTSITPAADLAITKTGPATVIQGATATYTIVVTNAGPSDVSGASVADIVPANFTAVAWTCVAVGVADCDTGGAGTGATGSGNAITLPAVQLNAGATNTVTITVTGTATTPIAAPGVTNTATVTPPGGTTDPTPGNNSASVQTAITPSADLAVTKTGPATVVQSSPGSPTTATYTLTMTNNGPSAVTGASLADSVPANFTNVTFNCVVSGTGDCDTTSPAVPFTGTGNAISLTNIQLNVGASLTVTVTGTPTTTVAAPGVTNTVTVATPGGTTDPTPANNTASVQTAITPAADLAITKIGPATIVQGNLVTYTVAVTNNGPSPVTAARVRDTVPSSLTSVSWTCSQSAPTGSCAASGTGNVIDELVNLSSGGQVTFVVVGTATTVGSITNTATVTAPAGTTDPVPGDNSASHATTITPSAELAITKTGPATIIQDQQATYTIVVTNNGPSPVTGASVADTVPSQFTGVTFTCVAAGAADCDTSTAGTGATGSGNAISLPNVQLTNGAGNSLTITVTATATTPTAPAAVTNTATVTPPSGTTDPTPANNTASVDTTIFGIPAIAVTKTAAVVAPDLGAAGPSPEDTLLYSVTVTNTGTGAANNVTIGDVLDNNLQLVAGSPTVTSGTAVFTSAAAPVAPFGGSLAVSSPGGITIPVNGTFTLTYRTTIRNPLPAGVTQVANQAQVSGTNFPTTPSDDPATPSAGDPTVTPLTAAPAVAVDKGVAIVTDAAPTGPSPGDVFEYTLTVTNTGNQNATTVQLSDLVDPNVTLISGTATATPGTITAGASGGSTVAATLGTIAGGGGVATVKYRVQVPNPIPAGVTQVQNQAVVIGGNIPSTLSNDPATAPPGDPTVLPLAASPVIGVTKAATLFTDSDGDGVPSPGDTILYTITITNSGNQAASGVAITDPIDATFTVPVTNVVPSQGTASVTGRQLTASLGTIPGGGGTATVTYRATVPDPLADPSVTSVVNQATVTGTNFPATPSDDPATPTVGDPTRTPLTAAPLVTVDKQDTLFTDTDGDGVPSPGDTLLYTVTITNTGNTSATSVNFNDTVDPNVVLLRPTAQASPAAPTSTLTTTTTSISATFTAIPGRGGTATVTFQARIRKPLPPGVTQVANQAIVSGANFTSTPSNDPDTATAGDPTVTPLTATPKVTATKTAALVGDVNNNGLVDPGDELAYTITVTNAGNQDATDLRVADTVEANLTLVAGSVQTSPVVSPTVLGANISAVFPVVAGDGGTATVSYRATVISPLPVGVTQVANQAAITGSNFPPTSSDDPAVGGANDPTVTPVVAKPIISSTKTATLANDADGNGVVSPGDTLEYVVTITNTGNQTASALDFRDTVGPNLTVVAGSASASPGAPISSNVATPTATTVTADFTGLQGNGGTATVSFRATINSPFPIGVTSVSNQGNVNPRAGGNFPATPTNDPTTAAADDPTVTPVVAAPTVTRVKTVAIAPGGDLDANGVPSPGDVLRYTITLTNTGNQIAANATLTDLLDANFDLPLIAGPTVTGGGTAALSVRTITASWTTITPGTPVTLTYDVTIHAPLAAGVTQVRNQGNVTGGNFAGGPTDDPTTPAPGDPNVTPLLANPQVNATKTAALAVDADGDGVPSPGDTLEYTVVIRNSGNANADVVTYDDVIDANLILQAATVTASPAPALPLAVTAPATGGGSIASQGPAHLGTIAGLGGNVTITYRAQVKPALPAGVSSVSNQGTVTGNNIPPTVTDDPAVPGTTDPTVTPLTLTPKLQATKAAALVVDADGDGIAAPGDTLLYTVTITNVGNQEATAVTFDDVIESNLALVAGSVSVTPGAPSSTLTTTPPTNPTTISAFINSIPGAGGTAVISFRATIDNPLPGGVSFVQNQGTVGANNVPPFPTDDPSTGAADDPTRTPVVAAPVIAATKGVTLASDADGDGVPSPGDTLLYTVTITNSGNQAATNVAVSDIIDPNLAVDTASVATNPAAPIGASNVAGIPGTTDPPFGGTLAATFTAIPGGGNSVTLSYQALIKAPIGAGVTQVANQAQVTGANFPPTPTDDPRTGTPGDPTVTPITANPAVDSTKAVALVVDADGNGVASPGDTLAYTVTIANNGNREATGVTFADTVGANLTLVSGSVSVSQGTVTAGATGGTSVGADIGLIGGAGGTATVSFRVTINNPLPAGVTQVANQGTVSGSNFAALQTDDPRTGPLDDSTVTPITASPVIAVDKAVALVTDADGNGTPSPDDTLLYTITIRNSGNQTAKAVTLNDIIDPNFVLPVTAISATPGTALASGSTLTATIGDLGGGGQVATVSYRAQVKPALGPGVTQVANQAQVSGENFPTTPSNDPATSPAGDPTVTPLTAIPVINATKTDALAIDADGDGVPSPGDTLTYTTVITNSGNRTAVGVGFSDTFDPNVAFVAGSLASTPPDGAAAATLSASGFSGEFAAIPGGGATATVTFRVKIVNPLPPGVTQVANQMVIAPTNPIPPAGGGFAAAVSDDPETGAADDPTVTPLTAAPKIAVTKRDALLTDADGNGVPSPGDTLLYTITVTNSGNGAATGVAISDVIDASLSANTPKASQGTATINGNSLTASLGIIPGGGGDATVTYRAVVANPLPAGVTQVANQAIASGNFTSTPSDDPDTAPPGDPTVTPLTANPVVGVTKRDTLLTDADGNGVASPGDTLLYTIVVTNTGNTAAGRPGPPVDPVTVSDVIPDNLTGSNAVASQGTASIAGASLTANLGVIAGGGASATVTFQAVIDNPLPPGVTQVANQATASGPNFPATPSDDPDTPTGTDPTVTPLVAAPVIAVDKAVTLATDADGNGVASPGDTLLYTISVRNTGNQAGVGSVLNDVNDPNVTLVVGSVAASQGTVTSGNAGGSTVGVDLGVIPGAGGSATVSYNVLIVNPLPAGVSSVSNQAVVTGANFPTTPSNDPATPQPGDPTVTQLTATPVLAASKSATLVVDADGSGAPSPGDTILYTVTVRNSGNQAADSTVYADTVDANTVIVPGSVQPSQGTVTAGAGQSVGVAFGTVPGGASVTVSYRVTINAPVPAGTTQVVNQGNVAATGVPAVLTDDPTTGPLGDPTVVQIVAAPRVLMTKTDVLTTDANGDGAASMGDTLTYTIVVENAGNTAATNVVVADTPDANTTLVAGSVVVNAGAGGTVTAGNAAGDASVGVTIPALGGGGERATISFRVTIKTGLPEDVTQVANQALLTCACPGGPVASDDPQTTAAGDPTVTPIRRTEAPVVRATKTSALVVDADRNGAASSGDTIEYTVQFFNTGDGTARNIAYADTVDVKTTIIAGSVTTTRGEITAGQQGGGQIGVAIGNVPPGSTVTIVYRVTVNPNLPATATRIRNQGVFTGVSVLGVATDDPATPTRSDPTVTPVVGATKLRIRKFGPIRASSGARTLYTIRITNLGPNSAAGLVVTDRLPPGMVVLRRPANARVKGRTVTWRIASLAVGRSITLTLPVRVTARIGARLTNTATVQATNAPLVRARARTLVIRFVPPTPTG